jgi:hypothetical protein
VVQAISAACLENLIMDAGKKRKTCLPAVVAAACEQFSITRDYNVCRVAGWGWQNDHLIDVAVMENFQGSQNSSRYAEALAMALCIIPSSCQYQNPTNRRGQQIA